MPIRPFGDAVLRRRAGDIAERLGSASTDAAASVAPTRLPEDAFVAVDAELARGVQWLLATASVDSPRWVRGGA